MHPFILQQIAAEHVKDQLAAADDMRRARQGRRARSQTSRPSTRLSLPRTQAGPERHPATITAAVPGAGPWADGSGQDTHSDTGTPGRAAGAPTGGSGRRGAALAGLALDVGLPLAGYYTMHALGVSDWAALLAATAAAAARLAGTAVWTRQISWFAAIMLTVFGAGLALAFVGGDPRFLLLKDSFSTALLGAVFLASLASKRPLTLAASQAWKPGQAEVLDQLYRTEPAARRAFRVSTAGWGLGLVGEASLRVPLLYLLPLDVMVGLSTAMMIGAMSALAIWNAAYITRAARRHPALRILLPAPMRVQASAGPGTAGRSTVPPSGRPAPAGTAGPGPADQTPAEPNIREGAQR